MRDRIMRALPLSLRRRVWFWRASHRWLHLRHPVTFAEKMNWRILYDRRLLLEVTCDKLAAKDFALERCAGIPLRVPTTYWSGTDLTEAARTDLPAVWVLKPNHRSGLVMFGSGTPEAAALQRETAGWLDELQWSLFGEWAYSFARQVLLVEERVGGDGPLPPTYKVFVFDGVARLIQVIEGSLDTQTQRYYTADWQALPYASNSPLGPVRPAPEELALLIEVATCIGQGFDFMRVDLYALDGDVWFGELSPYSHGGFFMRGSTEAERVLGALWQLPDAGRTSAHRDDGAAHPVESR